jgi:hypothetical protein
MALGSVRSDRMVAAVVTRSRAWARWDLGARVSEIEGRDWVGAGSHKSYALFSFLKGCVRLKKTCKA